MLVLLLWIVVCLPVAILIGLAIRGPGQPEPAPAGTYRPQIASATGPSPAPRSRLERVMLRRDDLLWCKSAEDHDGTITLGLLSAPGGQLGVLVDDDGVAIGLRLDRFEVQAMRDALTCHLVDTARPVTQ